MNVTDPIRRVSLVSTGQGAGPPRPPGVNLAPGLCVAALLAALDRPPAHQCVRWHKITAEPAGDPGLAPFRSRRDLFGDGSLVLLPAPGHTPRSMSLLVRRPGRPPLIMVGDVTYDAHLLEAGHVPGVGSRRRLREATVMINKMRQQYPGLVILPAHDLGAAGRLAQATGQAPTLASA
jgi:glyoxylase-like metal-dependent hydrolase (beta-lactamase superfamily II)